MPSGQSWGLFTTMRVFIAAYPVADGDVACRCGWMTSKLASCVTIPSSTAPSTRSILLQYSWDGVGGRAPQAQPPPQPQELEIALGRMPQPGIRLGLALLPQPLGDIHSC